MTISSTERPESVCPHCGGLGYVRADVPLGHADFGKLLPCVCRLAEMAQRRVARLQAMSNLHALKRMTFETFNPQGLGLPQEKQENLHRAYEMARAYAENPTGWLVLKGGYGCGKTHLAAAIANRAIARGQPVLFITVPCSTICAPPSALTALPAMTNVSKKCGRRPS